MKQIKMLKTSLGAVNGLWVKTFLADSTYEVNGEDIDSDLATAFVGMKVAKALKSQPINETTLKKANKMEEKTVEPEVVITEEIALQATNESTETDVADEEEEKDDEDGTEEKSVGGAPENKMIDTTIENKGE